MKGKTIVVMFIICLFSCATSNRHGIGFSTANRTDYSYREYFEDSDDQASPNSKYIVRCDDNKYIVIWEMSSKKIIYCYRWDDVKKQFPDCDTVFSLKWSNDSSYFWFYCTYPGATPYFARIDMKEQKTEFYSISQNKELYDFDIDADKSILFYSNYIVWQDSESQEYKDSMQTMYYLSMLDFNTNKTCVIAKKTERVSIRKS